MIRHAFLRLFPVLLALGLFAILTRGNLLFLPDAVIYWSAAHTVLHEGRLATGIAYPDVPMEPGLLEGRPQAFHALTVFAPGYSVTAAAVARAMRVSVVSAILVVNLVSGTAIILLVGALARRAGGERTGFVAAALLAALPFFQRQLANAAPEPLFVAFVLLALQALVIWMDAPDRGAWALSAATLAIAAATYTRYIGTAFYVVEVIVAAGWVLRRRRFSRRAPHVAFAVGLYPALMAPLIWRNLWLTGYLGGAVRLRSEEGVLTNVADVGRGRFDALPLVRSIVPGPADAIVSGTLLALATLLLFVWGHRSRRLRPLDRSSTTRLLALAAGVYCVILIALRSHTDFEEIGLRLMFPALVCLVVVVVVQTSRMSTKSGYALGAVWVMFAASATLLEASSHPQPESLTSDNERNRPVIRWVRENLTLSIAQTALLFSDDTYSLHFATGQPIHMLPPAGSLHALRANSPVDHLILILGPPTGLSRLLDEPARSVYTDGLDRLAHEIRRGEDYAVWCIPASRHERSSDDDCFRH